MTPMPLWSLCLNSTNSPSPDKFGWNRSFLLPCAAIICHPCYRCHRSPLECKLLLFITLPGCELQESRSLCRASLSSPLCPWLLGLVMTHGECSINAGQRGEAMNGENPCLLHYACGSQALGMYKADFLWQLWALEFYGTTTMWCKPWKGPYG